MLSYVNVPINDHILHGVISALIAAIVIIIAQQQVHEEGMSNTLACAFMFLCGGGLALFSLACFVGIFVEPIWSRELKKNGLYNEALSDFPKALPFLDDSIRLGDKYIFVKRSHRAYRYTEITRIYQHVKNVNGIEDSRELNAVDTSVREFTLCRLNIHRAGKSQHNDRLDTQLSEAVSFMLSKKPTIAVGYRP